jgi:hypothetical protein
MPTSIEHSMDFFLPQKASLYERSVRNGRPRVGQFSGAAKWLPELAVLRPADDGEFLGAAGRHSGCEGGTAGLSVGDANAPGEASAVAPRRLAGSDDAVSVGDALDCVYQLMIVRFVYPLELLFTATVLALVPYALLRGPFNRLARLFLPAAQPPAGRTSPQQ